MISKDRYQENRASIVDVANPMHRELRPGLLESVYEVCMIEELKDRDIEVSLINSGNRRKINGYIL
jgi:GxxExxY protein